MDFRLGIISVIIPTYNRTAILYESIERALIALHNFEVEIVVINDSKDQNISMGRFKDKRIRLFQNPDKGVASARNYGVSKAKGEIIILMDDDIWLNTYAIESGVAFINNNRDMVCVNPAWEYPEELIAVAEKKKVGRFLINYGYTKMKNYSGYECNWSEDNLFEVEYLSSYCLIMQKSTFQDIGGYSKDIPFGYEDFDFAVRAKNKGLRSFIEPRYKVYHNESDRMELTNWLRRKEVEGYGRVIGPLVSGHSQKHPMKFSPFQIQKFNFLIIIEKYLILLFELIPNNSRFDVLFFPLLKLILGTQFYKGYKSAHLSLNRQLI